MPEPISKSELEEIKARGGQIEMLAKVISVPGLEQIARHFHDMKTEEAAAYKSAHDAKLAKMDQLIKALESKDLADAMKRLCEIQNAMLEMKKKHMQEKDEEHEPCEYKLTGRRDRRGFIDIEHGLTFTPVKNDENAR